jgi:hypothetical protein
LFNGNVLRFYIVLLAAYVTIETENISQDFLSKKGVIYLLRTTFVMFDECYFIVKMLAFTVVLPLRRGVL